MQLSLQSANLPRIASSYDAASNSTRLIYTRWAAGGVVLLATAVGTHGLGLALPEGALYAVGILILAYNLVFHLWQQTRLPALDDPRF